MDDKNYRGYAFKAFYISYTRQLQWNQFAAANKYGYYPQQHEWIGEGMRAFDIMWTTATHSIDSAREVVLEIIIHMQKAVLADMKGHMQYPKDDDGKQEVVPKYDTVLDAIAISNDEGSGTVGEQIPMTEYGFTSIEDADLMRQRMDLIEQRLRPDDLKVLLSYVDGTHDSLTAACGGGDTATAMLQRRIRRAMRPLKGSVKFG